MTTPAASAVDPTDAPPRVRRRWPVSLRLFGGLLLLLPGLGIAWLVWHALPHTRIETSPNSRYEGRAGEQAASLELSRQGDAWTADWQLGDGREFRLSGPLQAPGDLTLRDNVTDPKRNTLGAERTGSAGRLVLSGAPAAQELTGLWTDPDGRAVPVSLSRVTTGHVLRRTVGWSFEGHGRSIAYVAEYPAFDRPDALTTAAERLLQQRIHGAADDCAGNPWMDFNDFWQTLRDPSALNNWEFVEHWSVDYQDSRLVSLLCGAYAYTGGAHGNFGFGVLNMWWNGHAAVNVTLEDFFQAGSAWRETLLNLCRDDLQGQQASMPDAVRESPAMLEDFTVRRDGFCFHFPPYAVGCYAEGIYEVCVPFAAVEQYLASTGPATVLPRSPHRIASRRRRSPADAFSESVAE